VKHELILAIVVVVYLCIGGLYVIKTPDWQVPDEPAHYNYIRQLAEERRFPVLELGDYDQAYLDRLTSERFPPELTVDTVEYEDWQPPLYYLLATPIYLLFDGALAPLRLFSVILGAGVVLLAYAVARAVFPGRPLIALGAAAFVAFLPQHVAMMAGVNNDSLTELLIGVALWVVVRGVVGGSEGDKGDRWLLGLGVVLGLGLVTKASFLPVALVVAFAILVAWWRETNRAWGKLFRQLILVSGPAILIVAPWWLRNAVTFGGLDLFGIANHDAVVVGQPRTADWIETYGLGAWLERWITFTFQSFWGQFGWMGVLMPTWLYRALALWSGVLLVGLLYWRGDGLALDVSRKNPKRNLQLLTLCAFLILVILVYLYYNLTFVQHQGRYLFPALTPIAVAVAISVGALVQLFRLPERLRPLAFAVPYLAMVALDLYALWRIISPALT
jgi:4-amino-4-deoxy-L-arabinose transferase-like glycosyltransferase